MCLVVSCINLMANPPVFRRSNSFLGLRLWQRICSESKPLFGRPRGFPFVNLFVNPTYVSSFFVSLF